MLERLVLCNEANNMCICHVEMFSLVGPTWSSVVTWRSYLLLALYGLFDIGHYDLALCGLSGLSCCTMHLYNG